MSLPGVLRKRYNVSENPLRVERGLELALVLLTLLVIVQLLYGAYSVQSLRGPEVVVPAADSLQFKSATALQEVTDSETQQIRERPLFWASRRPVAAAPQSTGAAGKVEELDGIRLVGVFGSGSEAGIIVTLKTGRKRLSLGETINGWELQEVAGNEAVLQAGARSKTLVMQAVHRKAAAGQSKRPARRR